MESDGISSNKASYVKMTADASPLPCFIARKKKMTAQFLTKYNVTTKELR